MPGMHGMAFASLAIEESDLLVALGMRFDDRITGKPSAFAVNSKKIHVDIDPSEIGKNIKVDVPIVGDVKRVLVELNKRVAPATHVEWVQHIDELKRDHPSMRIRETDKLLPQYVINQLSEATDGKAFIVTGVGQHQMWAAQHYKYTEPRSLVTSGGSGAMGYEVPGAMGAQVGRPDRVVWSVAGDGGFQMTMAELATLVENKIPVKFAIINNNYLGMVRQWQEFFYDKSYVATSYTHNPDFVKLAEAFGMLGIRVTDKSQVRSAIDKAMEYDGPRPRRLCRGGGRERLPHDTCGPDDPGAYGRAPAERGSPVNDHQTLSKHTITALVQDKPGVLNRVSSMFRRRGFNIASLAVGHSEDPDLSRMTFVVEGDDRVVEQVTKHLNKLIDVIKVSDISEQNIVSRGACPNQGAREPADPQRDHADRGHLSRQHRGRGHRLADRGGQR